MVFVCVCVYYSNASLNFGKGTSKIYELNYCVPSHICVMVISLGLWVCCIMNLNYAIHLSRSFNSNVKIGENFK